MTECTSEPTPYDHPTNPKIKFWDLPGIGTRNYPDLETYCKKVKLEEYDAFLIFTSSRFTENDFKLATKIKESIKKKFFFIRTKIDQDALNEQREKRMQKEPFDEDAMLKRIQSDCLENLRTKKQKDKESFLLRNEEIFLISNHYPTKWDFGRLRQAILDALPVYQRESLTFSLRSFSTDILKTKVEALKGRMWLVAGKSAVAAAAPIPGFSFAVDFMLIKEEIRFYRSQLGLPKEGSEKFLKLSLPTQDSVREVLQMITNLTTYSCKVLAANAAEQVTEEFARFIPIIGSAIAGGLSFAGTFFLLKHYLEKMEKIALSVVEETAQKLVDDF